jgi:hypothetical protein
VRALRGEDVSCPASHPGKHDRPQLRPCLRARPVVQVWRLEAPHACDGVAILRDMKVEEIADAIAKLPPDQLARFRRWFNAFEAGRTDHGEELDSTATKLGRLAGRAFAELKKRAKEP